MNYYRKIAIAFCIPCLIAVVNIVVLLRPSCESKPTKPYPDTYKSCTFYRAYEHPEKLYYVVVYAGTLLFAMPGSGGGDAPGIVCLYDADGNLLREGEIAMVQMAMEPMWEKNQVFLKFCAENWKYEEFSSDN